MDDNIKKAMLVSTLHNCALTWYIKHSYDHPNKNIVEIQTAQKKEFSRPKMETQSIIGFKEIMMLLGETPLDLDQRLKGMIHKDNMTLIDGCHHAWFVASLTPHLRMALSHQKLST